VRTVEDVLKTEIQQKIDQQIESLASGSAKDYAGYKEQVGVIRGLTFALYTLNDLTRESQERDDD
jgi:hypothetical protein